MSSQTQAPSLPTPKNPTNKHQVTLAFDQQRMQQLQELAQEMNTSPAEVLKKAYYLFLLAQGRTVRFSQKAGTSLLVDDFSQNKTRLKQNDR